MLASFGEAEAQISAEPSKDFTPDNDGKNDICNLYPSTIYLQYKPESWKIEMYDPKDVLFRTWTGKGALPKTLPWDGKSDDGEIVFSRNTYTAKLSVVPDELDRQRIQKDLLEAQTTIETAILFEEIVPKKEWKIVVNSIFFDPNAPTFDRISEAQRQSNKDTLDSVANQIKEHGNVKVIVEGYANNVSNTEEENINDLIPLSQARAEAIMSQLIERGLQAEKLSAKGFGGANPLAAWEDTANWWKNRRVEFRVIEE